MSEPAPDQSGPVGPGPVESGPVQSRPGRSDEELAMRALVVPKLRARWPEARIIHELPLRHSVRRIDLAAVTPTEIIAVEIKSSRDVMDRLEAQIRAFLPVSQLVMVCLAPGWNEALPDLITKTAEGHDIHRRRRTEAQELIYQIGAHVETWTCCAATQRLEQTDGEWVYRPGVDIAEHDPKFPRSRSHVYVYRRAGRLLIGQARMQFTVPGMTCGGCELQTDDEKWQRGRTQVHVALAPWHYGPWPSVELELSERTRDTALVCAKGDVELWNAWLDARRNAKTTEPA